MNSFFVTSEQRSLALGLVLVVMLAMTGVQALAEEPQATPSGHYPGDGHDHSAHSAGDGHDHSAHAAAEVEVFSAPSSFQDALDLDRLRLLAIQAEGRRKPLDTFAREKVSEITGQQSVDGEDPVFTLLSMVFEGDTWKQRKVVKVQNSHVAELITGIEGIRKSVYVSVADIQASAKLREEFRAAMGAEKQSPEQKAILETMHGTVFFRRLAEDLKLIPAPLVPGALGVDGTPGKAKVDDDNDGTTDEADEIFSLNTDDGWSTTAQAAASDPVFEKTASLGDALADAFIRRDAQAFNRYANAFSVTVKDNAPGGYPTENDLRLEYGYNVYQPISNASIFYFGAFLVLFVGVFGGFKGIRSAGTFLFTAGLLLHSYGIVVRTYLLGHAPVGSLYEATSFGLCMMGILAVVFECIYRNIGYFAMSAGLLGSICTYLNEAYPIGRDIDPLVPVLRSYWLNIHVTLMLAAYGALTLAFGMSLAWLVRRAMGADRKSLSTLETFNYRVVQVSFLFLTVGVGLGAVWANQSWGRYWDWDPKETWAFITWLIYAGFLHCRFMGWARGATAALWNVLGFMSMMFTYLGVSFLLSGLHSYLGSGGGAWTPGQKTVAFGFFSIFGLVSAVLIGVTAKAASAQKPRKAAA